MLSYWEKDALSYFDYSIAGGGILGLFTALELRKKYPNASIAIFERGLFPSGASTKNAGFVCFGSLTEILKNFEELGEDITLEIIENRWKGIQKLRSTFSDDIIDYKNYGGYELILDQDEFEGIEVLNKKLFPIFHQVVFNIQNEKIIEFGFQNVKHLLYNALEGQIHSGKLILELIARCNYEHIRYFTGAQVTEFEDSSFVSFTVQTVGHDPMSIQTRKLIFTTNAFLPNAVTNIKPGRGQILVTKPIDNLSIRGCFHFDTGYYYFRNVENRILIGGGRNLDFEGESTTEFRLNEKIQQDLIEKLKTIILPNKPFEIDMQWSGIMAFSENQLPTILNISDNVLYAMNCNGMGVSLSPVFAEELSLRV